MGGKYGDELCPRYQRAIDIIGKRWTCLILRVLLSAPGGSATSRTWCPG